MLGGCLLLGTRMSWLVRHVSWGNGLIQHSARDQTRGNNYQLLLGNTSSQLVSHNHDVTETLAARLHMHHIMNRTVVNFPLILQKVKPPRCQTCVPRVRSYSGCMWPGTKEVDTQYAGCHLGISSPLVGEDALRVVEHIIGVHDGLDSR